jgi:hypothetical protein
MRQVKYVTIHTPDLEEDGMFVCVDLSNGTEDWLVGDVSGLACLDGLDSVTTGISTLWGNK